MSRLNLINESVMSLPCHEIEEDEALVTHEGVKDGMKMLSGDTADEISISHSSCLPMWSISSQSTKCSTNNSTEVLTSSGETNRSIATSDTLHDVRTSPKSMFYLNEIFQ